MRVFKWQEAYKKKIEAMSSLDLLAEVASRAILYEQGTPSDHWEYKCAVAEMEKRLNTITLKAKVNPGWKDDRQITILEIDGDPLNIDSSGYWDFNMNISVTRDQIPESQEPVMVPTEEEIAKHKLEYSIDNNIKWDHLHCIDTNGLCLGPVCEQWLGLEYDTCPKAKEKI